MINTKLVVWPGKMGIFLDKYMYEYNPFFKYKIP